MIMRYLLIAVAFALSGCMTVNCSLQSGERNSVKSDQDQTPTTSTTAKIPLLGK